MHAPKHRGIRIYALLLVVALVAGACSGDPITAEGSSSMATTTTTTGAASSTTVSETVAPGASFSYSVDPGLGSGEGVEVAAQGAARSRFVARRIVLVFDDAAELDDILARYRGTVVRRFSTADYGLPGPSIAVIGVDPATADLNGLAASMTALGSTGEVVFGSTDGARLTAIAASERAAGRRVALDWLGATAEIPLSTQEDDGLGTSGWSPDAYELTYYRRESVQGIGVAEAWTLMFYAGVLENRVPIAILDFDFSPNEDFRDWTGHTMSPSSPFGEPPEDGWYHGHLTASTAVAVPDNGFGVAGVAGIVAEPILIQEAGHELSMHIEAMLQAYSMGARIISMSYVGVILADMLPMADAFDEVTADLAGAGVLMFSSAGNGGGNLDDIVAEHDWIYGTRPCQAPGVICVGGLDEDSAERHPDSTHGNIGGSVNIYAPYCVHGIPPPGTGSIHWLCGTSFSAPFAAGVAALIWASDPSLSAAEVWDLMESTMLGDRWPRVNAFDAVASALGPFSTVDFLEPRRGSEQDLNRTVTLAAAVIIPTDPAVTSVEVRVRFSSDRDGIIDDTWWTVPMALGDPVTLQRVSTSVTDLTEGTHTITVTSTYEGIDVTDTMRLIVVNSPPSDLQISRPADGSEFCEGLPVQLRGDAFDINEQLGLPESAFRWRSSIDDFLGIGRNFRATGLSAGDHTIALRVTDAGGLRTIASISVEVLPGSDAACQDLAPSVMIVEPEDGDSFYVDDPTEEIGVDEHGSYVVVHIRVVVSDDHDSPGELTVDVYVRPDQPDSWVGSGTEFDVRIYLADGDCSQKKIISVTVFDSAGNESEDAIEVFVNRFC